MLRSCSRAAFMSGAFACALGACSSEFPVPVSGAQSVLVIDFELTDGGTPASSSTVDSFGYQLATVSVTTLKDLRTLQGAAASLVANGHVNADYSAMVASDPTTAAALQSMVVLDSGGPVDFDYFTVLQSGGGSSIYAADADSLNMVTTYYNVELAYLAFQALAVPLPGPIPVYYAPTYTSNPAAVEAPTDLGITDPALDLLVVPTTVEPDTLSPGMQPGIIAYEYASNVFQLQAFGSFGPTVLDVAYGQNMSDTGWQQTINIERSFRAGFADFFGAFITQDPEFVHTSGSTPDPTRSLVPAGGKRCWVDPASPPLQQSRATYDPHPLGSVISAVLWDTEAGFPSLTAKYNPAVVAAMASLGQTATAKGNMLSLGEAADAIASNMKFDTGIENHICSMLLDRLGLMQSDIATCSTASIQSLGTTCAGP